LLPLAALLLLAGCVTAPTGPTVLVLPGQQKSFDQFRNDDIACQQYAQAVEQTHARHILIKVNEVVSEPEARHKINGLIERIRNGESFAALAKCFSQDGSAAKGGDLGWIYPGDTVPEFEQAMSALAPGQLSAPVQTPFGVHLIEVLERRVQDVSSDRQRAVLSELAQ